MYPSLYNNNWIKQQAMNQTTIDAAMGLAGLPRGTIRGKIYDVDDPKELGRVRVIFDALNPIEIPQIEGAGKYSEPRDGKEGDISHWIDTSPAFKGKQPPGLIGKRVNIAVSNGQYHYAILQDVLHDPQNLVSSAAEKLEIPNNSSMSRLPIYPAGNLPPACPENHGCIVIEEGGPMGGSWTCVCLVRNGKHIWVRHSDLAHGHAGGNDVTSQVDSSGNRPSPGQMSSSYDHVFVTSDQEMTKEGRTGYSSAPAGNPWGVDCRWATAPMDDAAPLEFVEGPLFNQTDALDVARNSGFIDDITGAFTTSFNPDILAAVETIPGSTFALQAIGEAQKALKLADTLRQIVTDPLSFVKTTAEKTFSSYSPAATKFVISTLQNPAGTIQKAFSSLPTLPNPFK